MKREYNTIEIETPFPESIKRIRYQNNNLNNLNCSNKNNLNNNNINNNNNNVSNGKIWSPKYIVDEQKLRQLEQKIKFDNYSDSAVNTNNSSSINNINTFTLMTPIATPPNQLTPPNSVNNNSNKNPDIDPYCEVEEYMLRGYENFSQDITSIQYGLYDLTPEEIAMMTPNSNKDNTINNFTNMNFDIEMI